VHTRRRSAVSFALAALVVGGLASSATPASAGTVVGLWHMDETSGTTAHDSSGHGNDGRNSNITYGGGAYSFNGRSSRVLVSDDASLDPGNADITISLKVKFTVPPSRAVHDYDLVRKGDSIFYKIEITLAGRARCQFHGSSHDGGIVFGPDLSNGQWHTITCTKTATKISGSVDGKSASRSVQIGSISNGVALSLGGKASGTQDLYQGQMDEVKITIG
jgi:hypothetical protein